MRMVNSTDFSAQNSDLINTCVKTPLLFQIEQKTIDGAAESILLSKFHLTGGSSQKFVVLYADF